MYIGVRNYRVGGMENKTGSGNCGLTGMYRLDVFLLGLARNEGNPLAIISTAMRFHIVFARAAVKSVYLQGNVGDPGANPSTAARSFGLAPDAQIACEPWIPAVSSSSNNSSNSSTNGNSSFNMYE